jgi:hypothetical protein
MNLHDEIKTEAYYLYEKSRRIEGRDLENWFEAEKIVMERHAAEQEQVPVQETEDEKTVKEPQPEPEKGGKKKR